MRDTGAASITGSKDHLILQRRQERGFAVGDNHSMGAIGMLEEKGQPLVRKYPTDESPVRFVVLDVIPMGVRRIINNLAVLDTVLPQQRLDNIQGSLVLKNAAIGTTGGRPGTRYDRCLVALTVLVMHGLAQLAEGQEMAVEI